MKWESILILISYEVGEEFGYLLIVEISLILVDIDYFFKQGY